MLLNFEIVFILCLIALAAVIVYKSLKGKVNRNDS